MKRMIAFAAAVLLTLACAASVSAGVFDDYNDYENEDGTYTYYFEQGIKVTMDKDWYQKTIVKTDNGGATFYHKASYEAYEKEGFDGGRLFTIGASVNRSFENLPRFEYIGFDEEEAMNYYAVLPTDVQAYMKDEQISDEYVELYQKVEDVIAGIEIVGGSDGKTLEKENSTAAGNNGTAAAGGNESSSAAAGGNETAAGGNEKAAGNGTCTCQCPCCGK